MTSNLDNSNVSKVLGKTVNYPNQYDASILVREPRQGNRKHLNLDDDDLPFTGYDIWNAWEVSCLTKHGCPVTAIAKIVYPCDNEYIVESKSLKLYFNSFNMTKLGDDSQQARALIESDASADLSELLETDVAVSVFDPSDVTKHQISNKGQYFSGTYATLEDLVGCDEWYFTFLTRMPASSMPSLATASSIASP